MATDLDELRAQKHVNKNVSRKIPIAMRAAMIDPHQRPTGRMPRLKADTQNPMQTGRVKTITGAPPIVEAAANDHDAVPSAMIAVGTGSVDAMPDAPAPVKKRAPTAGEYHIHARKKTDAESQAKDDAKDVADAVDAKQDTVDAKVDAVAKKDDEAFDAMFADPPMALEAPTVRASIPSLPPLVANEAAMAPAWSTAEANTESARDFAARATVRLDSVNPEFDELDDDDDGVPKAPMVDIHAQTVKLPMMGAITPTRQSTSPPSGPIATTDTPRVVPIAEPAVEPQSSRLRSWLIIGGLSIAGAVAGIVAIL